MFVVIPPAKPPKIGRKHAITAGHTVDMVMRLTEPTSTLYVPYSSRLFLHFSTFPSAISDWYFFYVESASLIVDVSMESAKHMDYLKSLLRFAGDGELTSN